MRECSWAAAGMLAGADPENPAALRPLSHFSLQLYPEFLEKIERLTGNHIPIRTTQTLQGAPMLSSELEPLNAAEIDAVAPGFNLRGLKFFLMREQSLDPRDLARALPQAARAAGITLLEQTAVHAAMPQPHSVHLGTSAGEWSAANFVNACGAWASELAGVPITPRKGQMLLVQMPETSAGSQPLAAVIRTPELYLVPRGGGRIVIGATVENAGYDKHTDPAAIAALHKAAAELWPPIREARVVEFWAGLRPAAPDFLPIIGPSPAAADIGQHPRSWLALGHFRNGILLAPATARLLRQMILQEPLSLDAGVFSAARFAESFAQ